MVLRKSPKQILQLSQVVVCPLQLFMLSIYSLLFAPSCWQSAHGQDVNHSARGAQWRDVERKGAMTK
jgi:hypothetical protein